jgi:hypothetical protein
VSTSGATEERRAGGGAASALGLSGRLSATGMWALIGVLLGLVALNLPELGSDPWPFRPGAVDPTGVLGPLVRAAGEEWDVGIARAACLLAGLALALIGAWALRRRGDWPAWAGTLLAVGVALALLLPSTLLQVGLRDATDPWFFTNDSTYQIEIAGDLLREGSSPYGYDYGSSGLERFYSLDGSVSEETFEQQVALTHFAYFPGTPATAGVWTALPRPWDDYRIFVALATLAAFPAAFLFVGPLSWRLAVGAVIAGNPLAVRATWFGTADAPSILLVLVAFGLLTRSRYSGAAAALAGAVLMRQFALVAVPFLAVMILTRASRRSAAKAGITFGAVLFAGLLPFAIANPGAFWSDTISYGTETYRIVGYGLAQLLEEAGLVSASGDYPFLLLVLLVWLPATAALVAMQLRSRDLRTGAVSFSVSMFLLLFLARAFQTSHMIWPALGIALACLLSEVDRTATRDTATPPA